MLTLHGRPNTSSPIFDSVPLAGSEPQAKHKALDRGKKMPPERAATCTHHPVSRRAQCQHALCC